MAQNTKSHSDILFEAATTGNLPFLEQHADNDLLIKARDRHGSTLLHYAAGSGQMEVCRYLLDIDNECTNIDGMTETLLDATSTNNGRTALHWSARNGQTSTCRLLANEMLARGYHRASNKKSINSHKNERSSSTSVVDVMAKGQVTPLQLAVWQCHLITAECLVQEFNANPHFINAWGCSVAHWLGKSPNFSSEEEDSTRRRRRRIQEECCIWLFHKHKIPYNLPNHHGQTPLHKAAYAGNLVVARYLVLELQVLDTVRDHQGNNAADCAERTPNNSEMTQWLRRFASPYLKQALGRLEFHGNNTNVPPISELRARYLTLAKDWHPDRRRRRGSHNKINNEQCKDEQHWGEINDAYSLLLDWHENPILYDTRIRICSRNAALAEYLPLCWHDEWHQQQQRRTCATASKSSPAFDIDKEALQEFERRLIRLLTPLGESGISISQLPKEYEKNWHMPLPKPRDYKCRRLIQLVKKHCPNIVVVEDMGTKTSAKDQPAQQARLRVALQSM